MAGNFSKTDSLKLLWADEFLFRDNFDRSPFCLAHALSDHPLFELPRLIKLADALKRHPNCVVYDAGDVRVEQRWNQRPASQYTLEEAMERIECTGAWVILKHTELDSE